MAIPTLDAALAAWSTNFQERGSTAPGDVGLTAAQIALYTPLHDAYIDAYNACSVDGAKSQALVLARRAARDALLPYARELYAFIQANRSVSDENKALFGVLVPDRTPTPIPPPAMKAAVLIQAVNGRAVDARIIDPANPTRRAWPDGVKGATIFSHTGEDAPAELTEYVFQASVTRPDVTVDFPASVPAGTKVWLLAFFFNPRSQSGPASDPVSAYLQHGVSTESA